VGPTTAKRAPGPSGWLALHHLIAFHRDPLAFLTRLAQVHGDVVRFRLGPYAVYLVNHPDHVHDVLVRQSALFHKSRGLEMARRLVGDGLLTSEDELHRRQRRLVQPAFHRQQIDGYTRTLVAWGVRACAGWRVGETLDVDEEMRRITRAVIVEMLLGLDVATEGREVGALLQDAMRWLDRITGPFGGLLARLPLPSNRRFRGVCRRLDVVLGRSIDERRAPGGKRGDLLSLLVAARDEQGSGMSDRQLRDEALTLFVAGHETIANALTWTWHLLSRHPDVEARFHDEVDAVLSGPAPRAEDVARLRYTEMVLAESMRLYPPAWLIGRRALVDCEVGGFLVAAGAIVLVSPWVTHRDPRFHPSPLAFDPERWTAAGRSDRPRLTYLPFGAGPRVCIGEELAWTEGVLLLATIGRRWRLRPAPGARIATRAGVTLRPRHGMSMVLEARSGSS
jgi:cytochrome P450